MTEPIIVDGKVFCQCGKEPELQQFCGDNGSNMNGVSFVMECPSCGDKGQDPYKSQMAAISVWENENWAK